MQSVINSVKGTALGVAEYLTPVLKVRIVLLIISHYVLLFLHLFIIFCIAGF